MKSLILIAVLAALTVCNDAASIPNVAALYEEDDLVYREDIDMYQKGDVRIGDIMFPQHTTNLPGIPHTEQREDISYRGNSTTKITGVQVTWPAHLFLYTSFTEFGTTHMTVRVRSKPGQGLFATVQIWGHYTDWV